MRRLALGALTGLIVLAGAACGSSQSTSPESPGSSASSSAAGRNMPTGAAGSAVADAGWKPGLDSEFDGSRLDTRLWRIGEPWEQPPGFQEGPQAYCPLPQGQQVTVSDGALHLTATTDPQDPGRLLSCSVNTRGTFSMTHGYVEARVKLPAGAGLWPSFWLLGNGTGAQGWPKTGEIDAFEFVNNGTADGVPFVTTHWGGNCPEDHCSLTQLDPPPPRIEGYGSRWITYGLLRTADRLTIYVDGKETVSMRRGERNPQGVAIGDVIFDSPMHLKLDLSAGGWAANPHKATQPGEYSIDYVRAWT